MKSIALRILVFLILYFSIYAMFWYSPLKEKLNIFTPIIVLIVFYVSKPITTYLLKKLDN